MITDNIRGLRQEIEKRMFRGIQAGIELEENLLFAKYTANQSPPPSDPGDYPHEDSGQLADNIASHMADGKEIKGGVGVYGRRTPRPFRGNRQVPENLGGIYAVFLKENSGRQGIDDSFMEDVPQIRSEIAREASR